MTKIPEPSVSLRFDGWTLQAIRDAVVAHLKREGWRIVELRATPDDARLCWIDDEL